MANEPSDEELNNMSAEEVAELQKQNCIFCKISAREIPAKIIHETDQVICVLDINPASEGHILVYPKKHYMILPHIPEDILGELFKTVKLMSNTLLKTLQCKGTSIFVANGMAAGQKAPHVLIHVFPRNDGDGLLQLPTADIDKKKMDATKSSLKPYIAQLLGAKPPIRTKTANKDDEVSKKKVETTQKQDIDDTPAEKKKHVEKPLKKDAKTDEKKSEKPGVNLDDIANLFG
jgi:histidine triad (HIT) family protein